MMVRTDEFKLNLFQNECIKVKVNVKISNDHMNSQKVHSK